MAKTLQENLTRQLHDSVVRLQRQAEKVEFWASAVSGLAQPVPEYSAEETAVSRYVKPGRPARKRRRRRSPNQRGEAKAKPASA
ncbi:MAG TPA: hypothetical protein VJT13_19915 [Xanthobacteraceae bacterium]|nr:hypothetical protein [Xanthobacteraceae bacterium]